MTRQDKDHLKAHIKDLFISNLNILTYNESLGAIVDYIESDFISKASVREAIGKPEGYIRELKDSDKYENACRIIRNTERKELLANLGLSEEGKKDAK